MGLIGSVFAVASVAGPLLGGFFVEAISWRWVFYVNMPIGVIAVLVVVFRLHLHVPTQRHAIDYLGATLLTAGVSALILVTTWGGNEYAWGSPMIIGLGVAGVVLIGVLPRARSSARPGADHPAQPVPLARLQRRLLARLRDRPGDVRRDHLHPAVPAARLWRQPDELRPADAAADGRPARRERSSPAARSAAIGRYKVFPIAGTAVTTVGLFLLSPARRRHAAVARLGLHARRRRRHRSRDAGARARRPERRAAARHRRRHLAPRRSSAAWAARSASRCSARSSPPASASELRRSRRTSPRSSAAASTSARTQVHALPARSAHDFLHAFVDALQPVFLVGAVADARRVRARPALLKEVPLRGTTHAPADLAAEEAVADAPGAEAIIEDANGARRCSGAARPG